jgi:hypothetical protein
MHDPADFSLRIEVAPPEAIADDAATTRPFSRASAADLDEPGLPPLPRLPGVSLPSRPAPTGVIASVGPPAPIARIVPKPRPVGATAPRADAPLATVMPLRPIAATAIMPMPTGESSTNVYVIPEPEALPPPPAPLEPSPQERRIARADENRTQRRARRQKRVAWAQAMLRRFGFQR